MRAVKTIATGLFLAACAAAGGCRSSYKEALAARRDVRYGTGAVAMQRAQKMAKDSKDSQLGKLELGRLKMLEGDFAGSSAVMAPLLEDLFEEDLEGPVLKTGKIGSNILAATVRDDRAIPYETPGFELLFALQYQALNSWYAGRRDNARVYLRRAAAAQEQLKERYEEEHAGEDGAEKNVNTNAVNAAGRISAQLDAVANMARASYENAVAWYLMGIVFALEESAGNDAMAFRQAAAICPDVAKFAAPPSGEGTDVVLVYEESLVDMQMPVKIPLPFGGTAWSIDFPTYCGVPSPPSQMTAEAGGALAATLAPAVNVQALAYRTLRDRIPAVATRNVTRAAVKIAAQQAAYRINTGNKVANFVLMAGVLVWNVFAMVTDEADTRGWQTLPQHVHLARFRVPPGADGFTLRNARTGKAAQIAVPRNVAGPVLVWVSDIHRFATVGVVPMAGGTPSWTKAASLLFP